MFSPPSSAVSFSLPLMSPPITFAPSRANSSAVARPCPSPIPVTTATLPSKAPLMASSSSGHDRTAGRSDVDDASFGPSHEERVPEIDVAKVVLRRHPEQLLDRHLDLEPRQRRAEAE